MNDGGDDKGKIHDVFGAHRVTGRRVGAIVDCDHQPRWIAHALTLLAEAPGVDLALIVMVPPDAPDPAVPGDSSRPRRMVEWFVKADRRLFRRQPDPLERTSIAPIVNGAGAVHMDAPIRGDETAHARVREAGLDVILCFVGPDIGREFTADAQDGVWFFPDFAQAARRHLPVGFGSVLADTPTVETTLNELTPDGTPGSVRYRAVSAVNRLSPHYTERRLLWKMATFPTRALTLPAPAEICAHSHERRATHPAGPSRNPSLPEIVARFGSRLAKHALQTACFRTEWTLAVRQEDALSVETLARFTLPGAYTLIENPRDRFWADPFLVCDGDRRWLFVEEFPIRSERAHLAVMELRDDDSLGPSTPILARPYHLSYPFVFQWQGDWYMVPETLDNRTVDLYRSTQFPFEWTHAARLLEDIDAVDATLAEIGDRWWLFTTIAPYGGPENDELHIYHAASPFGPWLPHTRNPQFSDVRRARPAGRLFEIDGAWYRPAQDCSRRYGYAMTINRIAELSETTFAETCVARIEPTWAPRLLGTHTVNHAGGVTFVDGDRRRPRISFRH